MRITLTIGVGADYSDTPVYVHRVIGLGSDIEGLPTGQYDTLTSKGVSSQHLELILQRVTSENDRAMQDVRNAFTHFILRQRRIEELEAAEAEPATPRRDEDVPF